MGQTKSCTASSDGALPVLSYNELAKATNNFCVPLGSGGYTIYYGKLEDGRQIAVAKLDHCIFQQFMDGTQKLISRILPHKNLVSIYGYTLPQEEKFLLAHEFMSNGTLANHLYGAAAERRALPWLTRLDIAIDVANALAYLHNQGIIHSDVSSSSILLDGYFCAKLTIRRVHAASRFTESVYADNSNPDYVLNGQPSFQSNVYSFGVVLCELLSSKCALFLERAGENESLIDFAIRKIKNRELDELLDPRLGFQEDEERKHMMTEVADLAIQCLLLPVSLKPSITQVLDDLKSIRQGNSQFQIFSHDELKHATGHFGSCVGKGAFGTVYYGKLQDGREVAVKRFHEKDTTIHHFKKEIAALSQLSHQHLVSLYGYSSKLSQELMLVYQYISNDTLAFHLRQHSTSQLPWLTRLDIAIETASALAYLHDSGIIHRDIKPSNILLDNNFGVKVADFGLSRFLPAYDTHASTAPQGTYGYMDPEYIASNRVSDKSDVYSFGVVLFELVSSKPPAFMDGPHYVTLANFAMSKILSKALEELVDPSMRFDSDNKTMESITAVAELAFQCVHCPKELRPSMKQVLETLKGIKQGTWGFNQIT